MIGTADANLTFMSDEQLADDLITFLNQNEPNCEDSVSTCFKMDKLRYIKEEQFPRQIKDMKKYQFGQAQEQKQSYNDTLLKNPILGIEEEKLRISQNSKPIKKKKKKMSGFFLTSQIIRTLVQNFAIFCRQQQPNLESWLQSLCNEVQTITTEKIFRFIANNFDRSMDPSSKYKIGSANQLKEVFEVKLSEYPEEALKPFAKELFKLFLDDPNNFIQVSRGRNSSKQKWKQEFPDLKREIYKILDFEV